MIQVYNFFFVAIVSALLPLTVLGKTTPSPQHPHKKIVRKKESSHSHAKIKISGMFCSFCAQGIIDIFKKKPEVQNVSVDMETMKVAVDFKGAKHLEKTAIEKMITDAGFTFIGVTYE